MVRNNTFFNSINRTALSEADQPQMTIRWSSRMEYQSSKSNKEV